MRVFVCKEGGGAEDSEMVSVGTQTPSSWLNSPRCSVEERAADAVAVVANADDKNRGNRLPDIVATPPRHQDVSTKPIEELSLPKISLEDRISEQISDLHVLDDYQSSSSGDDEKDFLLPSLLVSPVVAHDKEEVPWPTVLKYLRESDSEASKYFRLDQEAPQIHRERECLSEEDVYKSEKKLKDDSLVQKVCQFCEKPFGEWSILKTVSGYGVPEACCWQFKEYCLLVAACLKQMTVERASASPTEISVIRRDIKAVAEEKARVLASRRRRWEARQRRQVAKKTLQSSSFYSLTKQTKTIQFSLLSPAVVNAGWTAGEKHNVVAQDSKRNRRKKKIKMSLSPEALDFLKKGMKFPQEVEKTFYRNNDSCFSTLLPDHTGQYLYPSGSVAVLIYSEIPGVLNYLLFNEVGEEVAGYADELGNLWCKYPPPNTHLLRLSEKIGQSGVVYSMNSQVINRWGGGEAVDTAYQPLTFHINKYLTLQLPRKTEAIINFSGGQLYTKITVTNKLLERDDLTTREETGGYGEDYRSYLSQAQARLKYLLPNLDSKKKEKIPRARASIVKPPSLITWTELKQSSLIDLPKLNNNNVF